MLPRCQLLLWLLLWLPACSTAKKWQEVQSGPMTLAEVYDGIEQTAVGDGLAASAPDSDRGLGIWQSRWRERYLGGVARPGRYRLRCEILIDEGTAEKGWVVRYHVERQKVSDLTRSRDPAENDWSSDGQDQESEFLFGSRLALRLRSPNSPLKPAN
ncbi:MAG: hypothetical protein IPK26_24660 [Planctomycetes bacterium]|nr:hypothetical protein [Planctomycetota bacterium]